MLLDQPKDQLLEERATAVFNCSYSGFSGHPSWIINGYIYSVDDLPDRISYRNQTMFIYNVMMSDNSTTYQCYFVPSTYSTVGVLYIQEPGTYYYEYDYYDYEETD